MKKILYSLIAICSLCFTSCLSFDDPVTESYGAGPYVNIAVTATADSTFTFSLNPGPGAVHYSVLVVKAEKADSSIVAENVLSNKYAGVYSAVFDANKNKTYTFKMRDASGRPLALPNTTYQIYAVAATAEGVVGNVTFASAKTTDKLVPRPTQYQFYEEDKAMVVAFSEAITRGEGAVKVSYYAHNELISGVINPVEVPAEEVVVEVEANEIAIVAPTTPDGAWVAFSWEEGAFVDGAGQPCKAFTSGFDTNEFDFVGLYGRNAFAAFTITDENVVAPEVGSVIKNWEEFLGEINFDFKLYPVEAMVEKAVSVTYANAKSTKTILLDSERWTVADKKLYFRLPEAPAPGDIITVNIAEGALEDAYGNANEAYTGADAYWKMFDFQATEDMVVGTFKGVGISGYGGQAWSIGDNIVVTRAAAYDGNAQLGLPAGAKAVIIENLLIDGSQIIGYFDLDAATVYVAALRTLGEVTANNGTVYGSVTYSMAGDDFIPFKINSDGTLTSTDLAWVATDTEYTQLISFLDKFTLSTLTKVATQNATVKTASVKKSTFGKVNVKPAKNLKAIGK